jgi:hypothetical protein
MSQYNNIKITPYVGVSSDPVIEFTGAGNSTLTLRVLDDAAGGITFEGPQGEILSLIDTDISIGSSVPYFSIQDFYGIPQIEAYSNNTLLLAPKIGYAVGIGTTGFTEQGNSLEVYGAAKFYDRLKIEDIDSGSGKFNTNLSHSVVAKPTGVLESVLTLPSTADKSYIVHSINVANVARIQPTGAGASVGISSTTGSVTSLTIDGVGVGYTDGDIGSPSNLNVSFATTSFVGVGTTGDPAYAGITSALGYITEVSGGAVTGVAITFGGFGYTDAPVVTFADPAAGGTTETGTAVLTYGEVVAAYLNVPGEGYTTPPIVSIASTTGTGALITADVDSDGRVIRLNLISRGYGYSKNNGLGNNEENEVYITQPPLAKTEVGVDVLVKRAPVGSASTIEAYTAFDVPIPVGGVIEILKQPMVLKPSDELKIRGIDADGSGLSDAIDVHISYEEINSDAYIGLSTSIGSTIGLATDVSGTLLSLSNNPIMLQSLRMTNTEFVGDYDTSVKIVSDVTNTSLGSTAGIGATVFFVSNLNNVTTSSIVSIGTFISNESLVGVGSTSFIVGVGKTSEFEIPVGTAVTFYVLGYEDHYLAKNVTIPSFASIELLDNPKRLERYSSLIIETDVVGIDTNIANTIDIDIAGKNIT